MSEQLVARAPVFASRGALTGAIDRAQRMIPSCVAFVATLALASFSGGYFPVVWGWSALGLLWVAGLAVVIRSRISLTSAELALLAGLTAFALWVGLSAVWSGSNSPPLREVERMLVYVAGVAAVLLMTRRRSYTHLLAGALAGIAVVSTYALGTRAFPERLGEYDLNEIYRLDEPLGYWNALGISAVIGILLALGFASRARAASCRALAAASIVVLLSTIYFTFGRGPMWALGIGLAVFLAFDPRRMQLVTTMLVAGLPAAAAVWLGSRFDALGQQSSPLAEVSRQGHRFALAVLALTALAGLAMLAAAAVERRVQIPRTLLRAYGAALLLVIVLALAGVFARFGSPPVLVDKAYDAFKAPPVGVRAPGSDLSKRLFSFSSNGRLDMWSVARRDFEEHPWVGSGAGTYERYWAEHRPGLLKVRDAHSLYAETLAELGIVGLLVLLVTLSVPLVGAVSARRRRFVPAAFGAYVAYLVHAGVDWDWEMPAVTLTALFCGAAILVAARGQGKTFTLGLRSRVGLLAATLVLAAAAFIGLMGNQALAASDDAQEKEQLALAESEARKAIRWAPWSSEPWQALAEVHFERNGFPKARAALLEALERDRGNWAIWYDLGVASEGRERQRAYEEAARLNPLSRNVEVLRILRILPPLPPARDH